MLLRRHKEKGYFHLRSTGRLRLLESEANRHHELFHAQSTQDKERLKHGQKKVECKSNYAVVFVFLGDTR